MGIVSSAGAHNSLTIRGIIGRYYRGYESKLSTLFAPKVGRVVPSNQESEPYRFTGGVPRLQVRRGALQSRPPQVYEYNIRNQPYEATMHFALADWRRDKTGQLPGKVAEMGMETADHWDEILSTLIEAGNGTTLGAAYDGNAFFSSRTVGNRPGAPTWDNDIGSAEVTSLDVADPAKPTQSEHVDIILGLVSYMYTAKNEFNTPVNGSASKWYYMVPPNMAGEVFGALRSERITAGESNPLLSQPYGIMPILNPWLTDDDVVYLFRAGTMMPCFFLQEEVPPYLEMFGPGSEYTALNDDVLFISQATRSVGFGEHLYSLRAQLS